MLLNQCFLLFVYFKNNLIKISFSYIFDIINKKLTNIIIFICKVIGIKIFGIFYWGIMNIKNNL